MSSSAALNRSAALASISVALLLVGLKIWAVLSTGSTAMLGSLADTTLDLVASVATLAGVWVAAQPADESHRFGHGKAEALAAMFQVVLISISALTLSISGDRPMDRRYPARGRRRWHRGLADCDGRHLCTAGLAAPGNPPDG
jgi:divalent metal cation (Fe/Co/Zn/Cd) transporter